jgi:uncharacterized protein
MLINISGLSDGEHIYNLSESASGFDFGELKFVSDIRANVILYKSHNQIALNIKVETNIDFECDRCLKDFNYLLKTDFGVVYKYSYERGTVQLNESDDEDLKSISSDTSFIDLNKDIREFILLAIPMKKVPEENDGICLFCNKKIDDILNSEKEDSINPVWEKLRGRK